MRALWPVVLLAVPGCGPEKPPEPRPATLPTDVAMVLDGVRIERAELEDLVRWLETTDPTSGHNHTVRYVLDRHLIPLAFARRDLAEQRRQQREMAEAMARRLGSSAGVDELRQLTETGDLCEVQRGLLRPHVALPEQRWLFDDEKVGRVSPVLELPQGFSLVAASDKEIGLTQSFDRVDACLVRFFTHRSKAHARWVTGLQERLGSLAKEAKKVHPDFKDAVPPWLKSVTIMRPESP